MLGAGISAMPRWRSVVVSLLRFKQRRAGREQEGIVREDCAGQRRGKEGWMAGRTFSGNGVRTPNLGVVI